MIALKKMSTRAPAGIATSCTVSVQVFADPLMVHESVVGVLFTATETITLPVPGAPAI